MPNASWTSALTGWRTAFAIRGGCGTDRSDEETRHVADGADLELAKRRCSFMQRLLASPPIRSSLGAYRRAWSRRSEVRPIKRRGIRSSFRRYPGFLENAKQNLKALADAGVPYGFGTDSGPPGRFPGYLEQWELELMVESGLTPMQAIVAATGGAARFLRAKDLGTLEPAGGPIWSSSIGIHSRTSKHARHSRCLYCREPSALNTELQARIGFTTLPCTSVSRKARP